MGVGLCHTAKWVCCLEDCGNSTLHIHVVPRKSWWLGGSTRGGEAARQHPGDRNASGATGVEQGVHVRVDALCVSVWRVPRLLGQSRLRRVRSMWAT